MTEKVSYFNKDLLNNGINLDNEVSSIYDDIGGSVAKLNL